MGNACASDRSITAKVSRNSSILTQRPPPTPRHNELPPLESPKGEWSGNALADIDEGGSPAIDVTKSQESIRDWLGELGVASDDGSELAPDVEDTKPADPAITLGNLWVLPAPSHYDADDVVPKGRVISAMMLETPKLVPKQVRRSYF